MVAEHKQAVEARGGPASVMAASIAISTSLSDAIDLRNLRLARIAMPAAWTAGNLTFQTSVDGVTYNNLYDAAGNEYVVTAGAAREIIVSLADFISVQYMKVRSGTAGSPVVQLAARSIKLVLVA